MILNILLRTSVQATEDESRVMKALELFLPEDIVTQRVEGHYGNPIILVEGRIRSKSGCRRFIELVRSLLAPPELERLGREVDMRVDEDCVFFLRFDKQVAYLGKMKLGTSDVISARMKLGVFPAKRENAIQEARKLLS